MNGRTSLAISNANGGWEYGMTPQDLRQVIGSRLRQLRTERKLSLEEVAAAIRTEDDPNVSYSTIASYERGRALPSVERLVRLARFYEVSAGYLVGENDRHDIVDFSASMLDELLGLMRDAGQIPSVDDVKVLREMARRLQRR